MNWKILLIFLLLPFNFQAQENIRKRDVLLQAQKVLEYESITDFSNESVLSKLDSLINSNNIVDEDFADMIMSVCGILRDRSKWIPVVELLLGAVSLFEESNILSVNQKMILVKLLIPLGAAHEELGLLNRTMDFYIKALKIAEENNFTNYMAMIYNNVGVIHYRNEEFEKAEELFLKALEINKLLDNKQELFLNYNNLAGIYVLKQEYDTALNYALNGVHLLDYEENPSHFYSMQVNIASLYLLKKEYGLSLTFIQNAYKNQIKHDLTFDLLQTYALFTRYYNTVGNTDSTLYYIEKALIQAQIVGNKHVESKLLSEFAKIYGNLGNHQKAFSALQRSIEIRDSINNIDNKQKTTDFEMIYNAGKKIRENEMLLQNITLQKLASDRLKLVMASLSLLLVIVVLFLIYRLVCKEKNRKSEELIAKQQVKLYEMEKEKNEELNTLIDKRNRELTTYSINMVKNNEFLSDINTELKKLLLELNPKLTQHKEHIRQMLSKLHYQNNTKNLDEFHYYFEQVHPAFYETLRKQHPDLTVKEERLCAFLKLGFSSKEISAITFREVRSVESSRNRLRKKLGLNAEDSLTEFLNNLYAKK